MRHRVAFLAACGVRKKSRSLECKQGTLHTKGQLMHEVVDAWLDTLLSMIKQSCLICVEPPESLFATASTLGELCCVDGSSDSVYDVIAHKRERERSIPSGAYIIFMKGSPWSMIAANSI